MCTREVPNKSVRVEPVETHAAETLGRFVKLRTGFDKALLSVVEGLSPNGLGLIRYFPRRASGFTLIELIVFIVIVSVGLAGVLVVFDTVTRRSADPIRAKQAIAVAESLLDEILNKNFCDPDTVTLPAPGSAVPATCGAHTTETSRDLYDDVDDYDGYVRTGVRDVTNDAATVLAGYKVSVVVTKQPGDLIAGDATGANYSVVRVTVQDMVSNQSYDVTGYKFNND